MQVLPDSFVYPFLRSLGRIFYRLNVSGMEQIPETGPAILVCNHVSYVDWLMVVQATPRPIRFVIDHMFFRPTLLRWILEQGRVVPIAAGREDPARLEAAYRQIAEALAQGELLCIFPEGQITYTGELAAFRPGVMKILKQSPVPVVPMALCGLWGSVFSRMGGRAFSRWPRGLRPGIELRVGAPIKPEGVRIAMLEESVRGLMGAETSLSNSEASKGEAF